MGDGNTGSINCAHGYFGDPFLSSGAPPCALLMAQPVPGSLQVENIGCTPFRQYVTVTTFSPGAFPNGWFFGLDISWGDLLFQATLPGPPFNGILDANGGSLWLLPSGVPAGITIYAVTVEIDLVSGLPNPTPGDFVHHSVGPRAHRGGRGGTGPNPENWRERPAPTESAESPPDFSAPVERALATATRHSCSN